MALNGVTFVFVIVCLLALYTEAQAGSTYVKQARIVPENVSEACSTCICYASSKTRDYCDPVSCQITSCGYMSRVYWADAGKPTVNNEPNNAIGAFERCVDDIVCSKKTIEGYMERHPMDCNGDNVINCDDYVRIHRKGPWRCSQDLQESYISAYEKCMHSF